MHRNHEPNLFKQRENGVTEIYIPYKGRVLAILVDTDVYLTIKNRRFYIVPKESGLLYVAMKNRLRLHQLIHNTEAEVDHINGDTLDNRKANLRVVTRSQNQMNKRKHGNHSSNFKGVSWNKRTKKWVAYIKLNGKKTHLGYFRDEMKAAQAYDAAARELFKEYARLNFPVAGEQCALTAAIEEVAA